MSPMEASSDAGPRGNSHLTVYFDTMIYNVGIDVAKDNLQAQLVELDEQQSCHTVSSRRFDNRPGGFDALQQWIRKWTDSSRPTRILMEATGVYHERLAMRLKTAGWYVSVVLPVKARRYGQSLGLLSKNDRLDAEGLAYMGAQQKLPRWEGIKRFWRRLRALTRHKQRLEELATRVRNQAHAGGWTVEEPELVGQHRHELQNQLQQKRDQVCKAIGEHLQSRPEIWEKVQNLEAIKGLSVQSIAVLLAETDGFESFTSQGQLVSYSGYDVVEHQSGTRRGPTHISKQGNSRIRRALHFPALNVVKYEVPKFRALWDRIYQRSKVKMKAYVAVQRKLLTICYHLWKKGEAFDPQYEEVPNKNGKPKKVAPTKAGATVDTRS